MIIRLSRFLTALVFGCSFAGPVLAQQKQTAAPGQTAPSGQTPAKDQAPQQGQADEDENPTPAPLTVGSMAIAANAALVVESMDVDVSVDRIAYNYKLKNKGQTELTLAASVALPDLEVNNEGTTVYLLPSTNAENVVGLDVKANGKPVRTTPYMQAVALGIDRLAELKAENIPLIPFGEELEKALGSAKPQTIAKLEALGLVTPRDPTQPDTPIIADWSLHVVHGWMQPLEPNKSTDISVGFTPIKAIYMIDATSLAGFDALKEQVCVTPQIVSAAKALLKTKGATATVADITIANDGPARWLENPPATVSVRKPTHDSLVVFCGLDSATQDKDVVRGKLQGNGDAENLRVLVFVKTPGK